MIRLFLKRWLPVLVWIAVIFSASADRSSGDRSSRIIGPIVRYFVPNISAKNLDTIVFAVRKAAHATEYAVLSLLLWHALYNTLHSRGGRGSEADSPPPWLWRPAILAFILSTAYAITDELHQTFVPSRTGQVSDVFIDSAGAALGIALVYAAFRWGSSRKNRLDPNQQLQ